MAKRINIPYNGKTYVLEFDRTAVKTMEKGGFKVNAVDSMPVTMIEMLFRGAFLMHHSSAKAATIEKIYGQLRSRELLVKTLVDMYVEAYTSLFGDEDEDDGDEGNPGWGVTE